jgi:hypothetical protein
MDTIRYVGRWIHMAALTVPWAVGSTEMGYTQLLLPELKRQGSV